MGTTHRFLALGDDLGLVADWFSALPQPPTRVKAVACEYLYFNHLGPLTNLPASEVPDGTKSPVVALIAPERKREVLWTGGEVQFLPTPLRSLYPALHTTSTEFRKWITQFKPVFAGPGTVGAWDYYLEGGLRNFDSPIYALPEALAVLGRGQYFVDRFDTDFALDKLCKMLRLRGVG